MYRGPYKEHAPDLIPGYQRGYRVSWETAIGRTTEAVFHAAHDDPRVLDWIGLPTLSPGEGRWLDLAVRPAD